MNFNNLIYNALPYIYTIGGVAAMLLSPDPIGRASGVLLISAAMLVFHLRLEYRSNRADEIERTLLAKQLVWERSHSHSA